MLDMIGQEIKLDDLVLYPGGNARYGGLKLTIGLVTKLTEKRVTLNTSPLVYDGKPFKTTSKTGAKILKLQNDFQAESIQLLRNLNE
jgi:hypothetical protein